MPRNEIPPRPPVVRLVVTTGHGEITALVTADPPTTAIGIRALVRAAYDEVINKWREAGGGKTPQMVTCTSCRAHVYYLPSKPTKKKPQGGWQIVDAATVETGDTVYDHTRHRSHFATCPHADQHHRTAKTPQTTGAK